MQSCNVMARDLLHIERHSRCGDCSVGTSLWLLQCCRFPKLPLYLQIHDQLFLGLGGLGTDTQTL